MEIIKTLRNLLLNTAGVQRFIITDKEGIPIIGINEYGEEDLRNRTQLINSNQIAVEQIAKMNLGEQKSAIFCYETTNLVVLSIEPLLVMIIASSEALIGTLLNLRRQLEPIVAEMNQAICMFNDA